MDTLPHLLRWISIFLTDRTMKITINDKQLEVIYVNYGAPQESPLLFFLYVSDCQFENMNKCTATQFTDDISISITSKNIEKNIKTSIKSDKYLSNWCDNWRISILQSKTKVIHFSREKQFKNNSLLRNKISVPHV